MKIYFNAVASVSHDEVIISIKLFDFTDDQKQGDLFFVSKHLTDANAIVD